MSVTADERVVPKPKKNRTKEFYTIRTLNETKYSKSPSGHGWKDGYSHMLSVWQKAIAEYGDIFRVQFPSQPPMIAISDTDMSKTSGLVLLQSLKDKVNE